MGANSPGLQRLADFNGGGGFAAAGGAGQQHNGAAVHIFRNAVCSQFQTAGVQGITLGDERFRVFSAALVDFTQMVVGHRSVSFPL